MTRQQTLCYLERLARTPLEQAAAGNLRQHMPLQEVPGEHRGRYTYWELIGRLLCGMAPWLESTPKDSKEKKLQEEMLTLAHQAIAHQVTPSSPDYTDFAAHGANHSQLIVDAAFLAQGFLRSPEKLWGGLDYVTQRHVLDAFELLRDKRTVKNNWFLFSGEIEAVLYLLGEEYRPGTLRQCYQSFEDWYVGDGWYSDGPRFALDYYNSLVIHPMLLDISATIPEEFPPGMRTTYVERAQRQVELLSRMVHPDGSYPVTGRSLTYRCGAFHIISQLALEESLPKALPPGAARELLGRVIKKTLGAASYTKEGYLTIGLCGDQPSMGEVYISTGSLYMTSVAFLHLGLPEDHAFWQKEARPSPYETAWEGRDLPLDLNIK